MRRSIPLLLLLFGCLAPFLSAQSAGGPALPSGSPSGQSARQGVRLPRRLYVLLETGPGIPEREATLLRETLTLRLAQLDYLQVLEAPTGASAPGAPAPGSTDDAETRRRAEQAGADSWLRVTVEPPAAGGRRARYRLYDLRAATPATPTSPDDPATPATPASPDDPGGLHGELAERPGYRRLEPSFWEELAAVVRERLPALHQQVVVEEVEKKVEETEVKQVPVSGEVTLRGEPGARVRGLAGESLVLDGTGTLTVEVPPGATHRIRADLRGYYPRVQPVYVGRQPVAVDLTQEPGPRFGAELVGDLGRTNGVGLLYHLRPGSVYLDARVLTSLFSLLPPFRVDGYDWDRRNLIFSLEAGAYLRPMDAFFRPALSVGGLVRLMVQKDPPPGAPWIELHHLFPFGVRLSEHFEFSRSPKSRFFIEHSWNFYIMPDGGFSTAYPNDDPFRNMILLNRIPGLAGVPVLGKLAIEWDDFKLGWRIHLRSIPGRREQ